MDPSGGYPVPDWWHGPSAEDFAAPRDFEAVVRDKNLSPLASSGGRNGLWTPVDPSVPRNRGNSFRYLMGVDEPAQEYFYPGEVAHNWLRPALLVGE
eukprot:12131835-Alexandrium_andersonii.AAC.1